MTRDQIASIFTDLGLEAPNKGAVTALLNAFNQEKAVEIFNAKSKAYDEAEAKYEGYIKPEDHQKIVDELNTEKNKGALAARKEKYKNANLNVDDEDVFNLIDGKLKDSKDFDKDLEEYVKAHPSFLTQAKEKEPAKKTPTPVKVGGAGGQQGGGAQQPVFDMGAAINEHYDSNK